MKDIVWKFSKPDNLLLNVFAGTFSAAEFSLLLDKHRRLVGCEKDGDCVEKLMAGVA